jgi:hypothetical protein
MENKLERRYSLVGQLLVDSYGLFTLTTGEVFYGTATGRAYARAGPSNAEARVMLKNEVRAATVKGYTS